LDSVAGDSAAGIPSLNHPMFRRRMIQTRALPPRPLVGEAPGFAGGEDLAEVAEAALPRRLVHLVHALPRRLMHTMDSRTEERGRG